MTPVIDGLPEKVQQTIRAQCRHIHHARKESNNFTASSLRHQLDDYVTGVEDMAGVAVPPDEIFRLIHPKGEQDDAGD